MSVCFSELELWILSSRDSEISLKNQKHLQTCPSCREKVERLRNSLVEISQAIEFPGDDFNATPAQARLPVTQQEQVQLKRSDSRAETPHSNTLLAGRYRLKHLLSAGGQAEVFLADDEQLERLVAVKIAHSSIAVGDPFAELIISESLLLAQLNHARLPQVYDSGSMDGRPYLVLEYVEGVSLNSYVESTPLKRRQIQSLIGDVVEAVTELHRHNILHLDLKPENVIVTPSGRCKLVDLGTGWRPDRGLKGDFSVVGGTVEYMPPEQYFQTSDLPNVQCDVYGIGAILYELLLGKTPLGDVAGKSLTIDDWHDSLDRLHCANVDSTLKKICLRAMRIKPMERFRSAEDIKQSLKRSRIRCTAYGVLIAGLAFLITGVMMRSLPPTSTVADVQVRRIANETHGADSLITVISAITCEHALSEKTHVLLWTQKDGGRTFPVAHLPRRSDFESCCGVKLPNESGRGLRIDGPFAVMLVSSTKISLEPHFMSAELEHFLQSHLGRQHRRPSRTSDEPIFIFTERDLIETCGEAPRTKFIGVLIDPAAWEFGPSVRFNLSFDVEQIRVIGQDS